MIRIALLDTTVPGEPGSMARYREQLAAAIDEYASDVIDASVEYLGCDQDELSRVPHRFRMWYRHWHVWRAARRLPRPKYDVIHLLDGSFGYVLKALPEADSIVTVHDVIPRLQADGFFSAAPPVGRGAKWLIDQALSGTKRCRRVCCVSANTAADLTQLGCQPDGGIHVIPMAVEAERFAGDRLSPCDVGLNRPFIFHLGNNGFYKNRAGVVKTFSRVDPVLDLMLVMAGPPADRSLRDLVDRLHLNQKVVFVEHPDGELLSKYYRSAEAFLFPSIYEGFGWPPLEAMSAGCPVVASAAGSLPEVVGDAGLTADCHDHQGLAAHVERLVRDKTFREQQVCAGLRWSRRFSTQRLAEQMIQQYRSLAESA